jgi:hypothetical protein
MALVTVETLFELVEERFRRFLSAYDKSAAG